MRYFLVVFMLFFLFSFPVEAQERKDNIPKDFEVHIEFYPALLYIKSEVFIVKTRNGYQIGLVDFYPPKPSLDTTDLTKSTEIYDLSREDFEHFWRQSGGKALLKMQDNMRRGVDGTYVHVGVIYGEKSNTFMFWSPYRAKRYRKEYKLLDALFDLLARKFPEGEHRKYLEELKDYYFDY